MVSTKLTMKAAGAMTMMMKMKTKVRKVILSYASSGGS